MENRKFLLVVAMFFMAPWLAAQNVDSLVNQSSQQVPDGLLLQEDLESLSMDLDEGQHWEDELEELSHRLKEPLNLNEITKEQLEQFPFLSDLQIEQILAYLYVHGPMQTIYELQAVKDMDRHTLHLLLPFVCVRPVAERNKFPNLWNVLKYGQHEVLTRVDVPFYTRKGYEKNYLGPALYHSLKYSFRYGEYVQAGITGEKDAGEPMFALHNSRGYDFYSYYLQIQNLGALKTLVLGNYRLNFGQGLVLGNGFGRGKSFSLATSDYRSGGIRKHGSIDEYNYFRGIAATVEVLRHFRVSAFYSYRSLDGVIKDGKIASISKTGLHRTAGEAKKEKVVAMQMAGGHWMYEKGAFHLGMTGIYYFFNHSYQPRSSGYAKYDLQGNDFYNLGMDYRFCWGRLMMSGEAAKGKKGYALLNRLQYAFSSRYRIMLLHRFYSYDYWAFFAHAWSEGSQPCNENGWYVAAEAAPWSHWRFFGSLDFFSFPWWRYRISKPSTGWEGRFQTTYTLRKDLMMYLNYRYKQKERDVAGTSGQKTAIIHQHQVRYRLSYLPHNWQFQTTVSYTDFHGEKSKHSQGWQVTQQAGYRLPWFPLVVTFQGTWFHTSDYNSRIYAYEKGLLYTFYTPSFYGRGWRCSAHLRYDLNRHWMLLMKLGYTAYQDRNEIGSGNDLIASNRKTDLQMQLRIKF